MENETPFFEPLFEKAEAYGKTSYRLFKLKAIEKLVDILSTCVSSSLTIAMLLMFIVFISIGVSLWLGELLGKVYYGFFIIGGFYAVIACVLHFFIHDKFKKFITNVFIKQIL